MIKLFVYSLAIFFIAVCVISCEYESNDMYNREVEQVTMPPIIQIVDLPLNGDSVYIFDNFTLGSQINLKFKFESSNQTIRTVRFYIDSTLTSTYTTGDIGVYGCYLSISELTNGSHKLKIDIYTESGTNSIADKLGTEGYVFSKYWDIFVDKDNLPEIKKSVIDGFVQITWPKYPTSDFSKFIVYKNGIWDCHYVSTSTFIDSAYVGEGASYSIHVVTKNSGGYYTNAEFQSEMSPINYINVNNRYRILWNKSKYFNAVDSFVLYLGEISEGNILKITQNPNDTTYDFLTTVKDYNQFVRLLVIPKANKKFYRSNSHLYLSNRLDLPVQE